MSDGEQEGHAEDSTRRLSEADLRGVEEAGRAEGRRSFGARSKEAQTVRRRKGKGKDHAKVGGVKPLQFLLWFLLIVLGLSTQTKQCLPPPGWRKRWMRRCPYRLGLLWQKGKERDWWSVDLEGEMEKPEVVGHLPRTEGGFVDPKGKMGHEVKEKPKELEMEMEDDVPQEESVDIQSPA